MLQAVPVERALQVRAQTPWPVNPAATVTSVAAEAAAQAAVVAAEAAEAAACTAAEAAEPEHSPRMPR
jgi:hypothetical protein